MTESLFLSMTQRAAGAGAGNSADAAAICIRSRVGEGHFIDGPCAIGVMFLNGTVLGACQPRPLPLSPRHRQRR